MPRFNRAYRGLYGNRMIQFGNKISFAENKSRRTWKPNVHKKSMYSETLGRKLQFRMTTYVMRCIRKAGGLDEYLMRTKDSELKFPFAIQMKEKILRIRQENQSKGQQTNNRREKGEEVVRDRMASNHATGSRSEPLRRTAPSGMRSMGLLDLLP